MAVVLASSLGYSSPLAMMGLASPFAIMVMFGDAAARVDVEMTGDPLAVASPSTVRWMKHDVLRGLAASASALMLAPVRALRLNVLELVSGSVELQVMGSAGLLVDPAEWARLEAERLAWLLENS